MVLGFLPVLPSQESATAHAVWSDNLCGMETKVEVLGGWKFVTWFSATAQLPNG